jgi:hypothetical protein
VVLIGSGTHCGCDYVRGNKKLWVYLKIKEEALQMAFEMESNKGSEV